MMSFTVCGYPFYAMSYLELYPDFICTVQNATYPVPTNVSCTKDEIYDNGYPYYINWDSDTSLHNWVETLDLVGKAHTLDYI